MSKNGKVVSELSKVWDSVLAKGRAGPGVNDIKTWISNSPTMNSLQLRINQNVERFQKLPQELRRTDYVTEETKLKVSRLMAAYEELIGMREVRSAHERVLSAEAKFIECQEERRTASKQLSEIQNRLVEIRAELDRTQRGDELYLDLIKKEISATKEERIVRKIFEDWERTEREVFSELSNALRFSHEKERAQNEKTKYWSIVGSVIGAALGILGTTINNRMKQSHMKRVLEQTSSQVAAMQATVDNLTSKVTEGSLTQTPLTPELSDFLSTLKTHQDELAQQKQLTNSMQESLASLSNIISSIKYHNIEAPDLNQSTIPGDFDVVSVILDNKLSVSLVCGVISYLLYKCF